MWRHLKYYYSYLFLGRSKRLMLKQVLLSRKFHILFLILIFTFLFGEFLIYYLVLTTFCAWPRDIASNENVVKSMIIADPHLLGVRQGHWLDKLRREWQMERTFQAALTLFNPDVVFVLGDLFDEGQWAMREEIEMYAARFRKMFNTHGRPLHAAVGNHDVGFHYVIREQKLKWFNEAFGLESVHMVTIRGVVFVLLNSMAFEGDHCRLCGEAERKLNELNRTLGCVKQRSNSSTDCPGYYHLQLPSYSRPILLQHFPLYRFSDAICNEEDEAPADQKRKPFNQRWDCLSEEATGLILDKLHPRVAFDGHSHFGCLSYHTRVGERIPEYTVGSFSCRNTKNPGFLLATFTPSNFAVSKCLGVRENTVYGIYIVIFCILPLFFVLYSFLLRCRRMLTRKSL